MKSVRVIGVLVAGLLGWSVSGCGGSSPPVAPLIESFGHYEDDIRVLEPKPEVAQVLEAGQKRRDEARDLHASGKDKDAYPIIRTAMADIRVALAEARLDQANRHADSCLREVERARAQWETSMNALERTESVVSRVAPLPRKAPTMSDDVRSPLPPTTLGQPTPPASPPNVLQRTWTEWRQAAIERQVPLADLESEFRTQMATVEHEKTKEEERMQSLYIASRLLQELETRIRIDESHRMCVRSTTLATQLGQASDAAREATLELERGLQQHLRDELTKAQDDARDRQDDLFGALNQLEGKYAKITQEARGTIVSLADILFDFGKATLRREVEFALVRVATILGQFPEMGIAIEGHTDNIGSEEYNLELSSKRAAAVMTFLDEQGVSASRMHSEGFGMSRPVGDNATDEGRQQNRRVDLVIK